MRPLETVELLAGYRQRGAGTDAERRAAHGLASALERDRVRPNRRATIEPFWCRPNWALAHAWHAALGLAGSLLAEADPRIGAALVALALLSVIADATTCVSLGRRLTPERASQNVVCEAPRADPEPRRAPSVRLVLTANYDAGRTGLLYRDGVRRGAARLRLLTGRFGPGWIGWLATALAWVLVTAILRLDGYRGTAIGAAQLAPTVGLMVALALLLELAGSSFGPAAGDNASGVAAAIALAKALDAAPPRALAVDLVLQGAGDFQAIGLRHYLRVRRRRLRASNTVVIGIAACGAGNPRWWVSDGALLPAAYFRKLRLLCARIAGEDPRLEASPHHGRGATPALPARARRLPAITLGCLDRLGLAPRSHQAGDTPEALDPAAIDRLVEFGLLVIDSIDESLARRRRGEPATAPA